MLINPDEETTNASNLNYFFGTMSEINNSMNGVNVCVNGHLICY